MNFIRKNLSNILFVLFAIFLFTPYGLPVRALLIKGVSKVTTRIFDLESDKEDQVKLVDFSWNLTRSDKQNFNFDSLRGEVVVVNFWATWCPPCVAEMPSMQELYDRYGERVEFVFVARDEYSKVVKFIEKKGYSFPVYFERTAPPEALGSNSLPTTFIIDRSGVVRVKKVGAADWNSPGVHELLDEMLQ